MKCDNFEKHSMKDKFAIDDYLLRLEDLEQNTEGAKYKWNGPNNTILL